MKLLFVLENYYPHLGGVEAGFKYLCEALAKRGHEVTILTHRVHGSPMRETVGGVRIVRVRSLESRYVFTLSAIWPAIRLAKDADIVHTTTYNAAFPAWIARLVWRKPSVITVHEVLLGKWRSVAHLPPLSAAAHQALEWLVFHVPRFDRYMCVSSATRRALIAALPRTEPISGVIPSGFDPAPWAKPQPLAKTLRKRLKLEGKFVIFASGRPGPTKGFEYLVDAFAQIKVKIPNATLLLLLSLDRQHRHRIEMLRAKAVPGVVIREPAPAGELAAYRQMADCIVVPSVSEGYGYAVLEGCASGTPVVASAAGSIPEVIGGKHVLVKPQDPKAIADGVLRVWRKQYQVTPLRPFPFKDTFDKYDRLYAELVHDAKN
jgi:glycosyltransferase involved in cell wall biosynthesis